MSGATIRRIASMQIHRLANMIQGAMGDSPAAGMVNVDEVLELRDVWTHINEKCDWEQLSEEERCLLRETEAEELTNSGAAHG